MTADTAIAVWSLSEQGARLDCDGLRATLDPRHPDEGLRSLVSSGFDHPLTGWHLLGVASERLAGAAILDVYIRGGDLVVTYGQPDADELQFQIYWRALSAVHRGAALAAIDVQVSVQTSHLHSLPTAGVGSRLTAHEIHRLSTLAPRSFAPLSFDNLADRDVARIDPPRPGCCLFRPADSSPSYVEMIHPADFDHSMVWRAAGDTFWNIGHGLFSSSLEKGVILRSRVRGAFVPRQDDEDIAADLYSAFAAEAPPLTA